MPQSLQVLSVAALGIATPFENMLETQLVKRVHDANARRAMRGTSLEVPTVDRSRMYDGDRCDRTPLVWRQPSLLFG